MEDVPAAISLAPSIIGLLGIALAYVMYMFVPSLPGRLATTFRPVYLFVLNKWYFDELYDRILVRPYIALSRILWQVGDATIIDGIPNGVAALTGDGSAQVVKLQTGSIAVYAFTMLIGLVALVSVYLLFR
jgi:NADH-quinone oxidoreductase subunit L